MATTLGNEGVPVLATPMLLDLMEIAAANALKPSLPPDWVSLGVEVAMKHRRPTPLGFRVHAYATIVAVDRHKVYFQIQVYDNVDLVGEATHARFCTPHNQFQQQLNVKVKTFSE